MNKAGGIDLSKLSIAERQALLLLADGHTAKSAASRLSISVNTLNERLRSARSKVGVGSSRELARLISQACDEPQKIWSDKIGVAQAAQSMPSPASQPILTLVITLTRGALAMTTIAIGAGALAIYALSGALTSAARPVSAPHVVSTYPAANAEVAAGKLMLRVTFDRPMRSGGYSFVMRNPDTYPHCANAPTQSADGRSFTLDCSVEAGHVYDVGFNSARFQNFVAAADNRPAEAATLHFSAR